MGGVGDLLTKFLIPASGGVIAWLAVLASRKGANRAKIEAERADEVRADQIEKAVVEERRAETDQRMNNMQTVIDRLLAENTRLVASEVHLRLARDSADARTIEHVERVRADWEARWSRQMERCRLITEPLVATITRLSASSNDEGAKVAARQATDTLDEHNLEDHNR